VFKKKTIATSDPDIVTEEDELVRFELQIGGTLEPDYGTSEALHLVILIRKNETGFGIFQSK